MRYDAVSSENLDKCCVDSEQQGTKEFQYFPSNIFLIAQLYVWFWSAVYDCRTKQNRTTWWWCFFFSFSFVLGWLPGLSDTDHLENDIIATVSETQEVTGRLQGTRPGDHSKHPCCICSQIWFHYRQSHTHTRARKHKVKTLDKWGSPIRSRSLACILHELIHYVLINPN